MDPRNQEDTVAQGYETEVKLPNGATVDVGLARIHRIGESFRLIGQTYTVTAATPPGKGQPQRLELELQR